MANPADRLPQNVPGRYYVDSQCIDCDLCRETAPMVFARHDETGFSFVQRQPQTPEEVALAEEAIQGCPVEAIGNDGPSAGELPVNVAADEVRGEGGGDVAEHREAVD